MANARNADEGPSTLPPPRPPCSAARVSEARPFDLVVLADFAAAERGRSTSIAIDPDTLDSFLGAFRPRLDVGLEYCAELELSSAAQLHPDSLCAFVHGLSALLEARAEAADPRRMAALAAEAGARIDTDAAAPEGRSSGPDRAPASDRALLDQLLTPERRRDVDPVRRLARSLGEAASDRGEHAAVEQRRAAIDAELHVRLRALLRNAELRRLDALCCGLRALVRAAPDPERVRIRAVHAPVDALEIAAPHVARASFLVAAHEFGAGSAGLAQLRVLANLARGAGVGALASGTFGGADWDELRADSAAKHVGLCHPRVLARLPYGAETHAIESFRFEELEGETRDPDFVWCPGALAAARALAACVTETGDAGALSRFLTLEDLPVYPGSVTAGRPPRGPTEELMSEREAEALVARGINPIVALRGSDQARMPAFLAIDGSSLVDR